MPRLLPKAHCGHCGLKLRERDLVPVKIKASTGEEWATRFCPSCVKDHRKKPWFSFMLRCGKAVIPKRRKPGRPPKTPPTCTREPKHRGRCSVS